jgi:hypothetical protein
MRDERGRNGIAKPPAGGIVMPDAKQTPTDVEIPSGLMSVLRTRNSGQTGEDSMKVSFYVFLVIVSLALVSTAPMIARGQVGTSCADCPNYSGAFSIENQTGVTVPYQVRWGNKHPWQNISLASGRIETHRYPLGDNKNAKVPTPYVRFDSIGGDGRFTAKEYRMEFYAVGYAGYGPQANTVQPKRYFFKYAADGKSLDIKAR